MGISDMIKNTLAAPWCCQGVAFIAFSIGPCAPVVDVGGAWILLKRGWLYDAFDDDTLFPQTRQETFWDRLITGLATFF